RDRAREEQRVEILIDERPSLLAVADDEREHVGWEMRREEIVERLGNPRRVLRRLPYDDVPREERRHYHPERKAHGQVPRAHDADDSLGLEMHRAPLARVVERVERDG